MISSTLCTRRRPRLPRALPEAADGAPAASRCRRLLTPQPRLGGDTRIKLEPHSHVPDEHWVDRHVGIS